MKSTMRAQLLEEFSYYPDTGDFTRNKSRSPRYKVGSPCGWVSGSGYKMLRFCGRSILAHRAAFLMYHGWLPKVVDHIDRNPLNNRIENLRAASKSLNGANRPKQANNTSGFKGVRKHRDKWAAQIHLGGKNTYLGLFDSPERAHAAYLEAAKQEFGEFFYA